MSRDEGSPGGVHREAVVVDAHHDLLLLVARDRLVMGSEAFRRGGVHHRLGILTRSWMRRLSVPGVAMALTVDGSEATAGFGVTSVSDPIPTNDRTLFQVGSITKTFTATALMRLEEDGLLELDAPVRTYVPELRLSDRHAQRTATVRHLLTHTGGWEGDVPGSFGRGDDALSRLIARMAELQQLARPGTIWSYNNVGFSLAGRVVEAVTGLTFEDALTDLVLAPLALDASFMLPEQAIGHRVAAGHVVRPEGVKVAHPWAGERAGGPSGGLISTAGDLLRWIRLHLGERVLVGRRLIAGETIRRMRERQTAAGSVADGVALPWLLADVGDTTVVFHMGDTIVHQALVVLAIDNGFGLALLSNADAGARLCGELADWALRRYVGVTRPAVPAVAMSTRALAEYRGTYQTRLWRFHVRPDAGSLLARVERTAYLRDVWPRPWAPGAIRLRFIDQDRVVSSDRSFLGTRGEFGRDEHGDVTWLRLFGRIAPRARGMSSTSGSPRRRSGPRSS